VENSFDLVRFPGFEKCENPDRCMEMMIDLERVDQAVQITPGGLKAHGGTEAAKQNIREQIKKKYAQELKQFLMDHPQYMATLKMTPQQVLNWTPEQALGEDEIVDVQHGYRTTK
jgi:hypothetical protein